VTWVHKRHEKDTRRKLRARFGTLAAGQIEEAAKADVFNITVERGRLKMSAPGKVAQVTQDWLMERIYDRKRELDGH
jgi:hypothetical protein